MTTTATDCHIVTTPTGRDIYSVKDHHLEFTGGMLILHHHPAPPEGLIVPDKARQRELLVCYAPGQWQRVDFGIVPRGTMLSPTIGRTGGAA